MPGRFGDEGFGLGVWQGDARRDLGEQVVELGGLVVKDFQRVYPSIRMPSMVTASRSAAVNCGRLLAGLRRRRSVRSVRRSSVRGPLRVGARYRFTRQVAKSSSRSLAGMLMAAAPSLAGVTGTGGSGAGRAGAGCQGRRSRAVRLCPAARCQDALAADQQAATASISGA